MSSCIFYAFCNWAYLKDVIGAPKEMYRVILVAVSVRSLNPQFMCYSEDFPLVVPSSLKSHWIYTFSIFKVVAPYNTVSGADKIYMLFLVYNEFIFLYYYRNIRGRGHYWTGNEVNISKWSIKKRNESE